MPDVVPLRDLYHMSGLLPRGMASLVRQRLPSTRFNVGDDPPVEVLDELVKILFQAEDLHNRIMHSSWVIVRLESYARCN